MTPRVALLCVLLLAVAVLLLVYGMWHEPAAEQVKVKPAAVVWPQPTSTSSTTWSTTVVVPVARTAPSKQGRAINSSAYCETGRMANGQFAHDGAVSSKILPRGSRWLVLDGRFAGRVFTVEDTGSLAIFDVALPGRCTAARAYGAPTIHIEEVTA